MNEEIQRKTAKNEWENNDSDFLLALCSLYKKKLDSSLHQKARIGVTWNMAAQGNCAENV